MSANLLQKVWPSSLSMGILSCVGGVSHVARQLSTRWSRIRCRLVVVRTSKLSLGSTRMNCGDREVPSCTWPNHARWCQP